MGLFSESKNVKKNYNLQCDTGWCSTLNRLLNKSIRDAYIMVYLVWWLRPTKLALRSGDIIWIVWANGPDISGWLLQTWHSTLTLTLTLIGPSLYDQRSLLTQFVQTRKYTIYKVTIKWSYLALVIYWWPLVWVIYLCALRLPRSDAFLAFFRSVFDIMK